MQVHNPSAKQTIFAVNTWSSGQKTEASIGNSPKGNLDYTFRGNAGEYQLKRLAVAANILRNIFMEISPGRGKQRQFA